ARGVEAITLEVAADNAPALSLYKSLGFSQVGVRAGYYRRPDATLMDAHLLRLIVAPATN
ncbi:MAG TPA: ribosomal-protein-alanine acetyltransferase, partial [Stellaceae bacterium]|nr:ribosomal-protein-alanine acetyltransferase [Stellaceae bacterium]